MPYTIPSLMLIEEYKLRYWMDNFYGYGSWAAPVWFIAHEEGGGDLPEEVAEKINYLAKEHSSDTSQSLCNIRELYKHVAVRWEGPKEGMFKDHFEYRFGNNAVQHGVWKNLIAFEHGYNNQQLPDLLDYQKNIFAAENEQALIRLYPLPSPHNHAWYYSWLDLPKLNFIKSRAQYEDHIYPHRIRNILCNISAYKPELVLMYGMTNINKIKNSIQDHFSTAKFKMIKATKQLIPQHHKAELNGTTMLITTQIPALRHNRIETGFDWYAFGKRVKAEHTKL